MLPYVVSNKERQYSRAEPKQPAGNEGEGKFKINKKDGDAHSEEKS